MKCPLCTEENHTKMPFGYNIQKCNNCKLVFEPVSDEEIEEYYKDYFQRIRKSNEEMNNLRTHQYEKDVSTILQYCKSGKVLDIGCSHGEFLAAMAKHPNFVFHGIDIDPTGISYAKEKYQSELIKFTKTDVLGLSTDTKYDAIIFRGTLQYMGMELHKILEKVKSLLTENGFVFIFVLPNSDSFIFHLLKEKWNFFLPRIENKLMFNTASVNFIAKKFDLEMTSLSYPYLETVYADLEKNYEDVIKIITSGSEKSPAFWGNVMEVVLKNKPSKNDVN